MQGSSTKTTVNEAGDDPTVTTEVESNGVRRRSGRLKAKENGLSYADATKRGTSESIEEKAEDPRASNGDATHEAQNGGTEDSDDLVVVIAGGMSSTLTYDGIDVNASRVAWEVSLPEYAIWTHADNVQVDEKIAELEANGKKVTRFSVVSTTSDGSGRRNAKFETARILPRRT